MMLQSFDGSARDLIDLIEETVMASKAVRHDQSFKHITNQCTRCAATSADTPTSAITQPKTS